MKWNDPFYRGFMNSVGEVRNWNLWVPKEMV